MSQAKRNRRRRRKKAQECKIAVYKWLSSNRELIHSPAANWIGIRHTILRTLRSIYKSHTYGTLASTDKAILLTDPNSIIRKFVEDLR